MIGRRDDHNRIVIQGRDPTRAESDGRRCIALPAGSATMFFTSVVEVAVLAQPSPDQHSSKIRKTLRRDQALEAARPPARERMYSRPPSATVALGRARQLNGQKRSTASTGAEDEGIKRVGHDSLQVKKSSLHESLSRLRDFSRSLSKRDVLKGIRCLFRYPFQKPGSKSRSTRLLSLRSGQHSGLRLGCLWRTKFAERSAEGHGSHPGFGRRAGRRSHSW